jgi:hypothetical protein
MVYEKKDIKILVEVVEPVRSSVKMLVPLRAKVDEFVNRTLGTMSYLLKQ